MYGFYEQNRDYIRAFIIVTIICLAGVWLVYDHYRNEPIYNDTDSNVAELENRVSELAGRIDSLQNRLEQTQKTIDGISERIERSRENAEIVAGGIDGAEKRIDSAIQRSGRIANILADIERENRKGTQGSQATNMAE